MPQAPWLANAFLSTQQPGAVCSLRFPKVAQLAHSPGSSSAIVRKHCHNHSNRSCFIGAKQHRTSAKSLGANSSISKECSKPGCRTEHPLIPCDPRDNLGFYL